MNERRQKARNLESLFLEIEMNRLQMEEILEKAKKLRSAIASNKGTQKKSASVSK